MDKKVFILNGVGGAGKDTFVQILKDLDSPVFHYSYVQFTKDMLKNSGIDIDNKTSEIRKLLCDINNSLEIYDDIPFKLCQKVYQNFMKDELDKPYKWLFIDCREPSKIERMRKEFNAETVFVKSNKECIITNEADKAVQEKYCYDYVIDNTKDLYSLQQKTMEFIKEVINKQQL